MATITRTTVEVEIGSYRYTAALEGNRVELWRDGEYAGPAVWTGRLEQFPKALSLDARDALEAAIDHNLRKATFARTEELEAEVGVDGQPVVAAAPKTADAANHGQMGNERNRPSRQGEAEIGTGGPGCDPNTGELGGQAIAPHRRAVGDGFRKP